MDNVWERFKKVGIVLTLVILLTVPAVHAQQKDYTKINAFEDILYLIKNYYVEDMDNNQLIEGAIDGMLNEADPYSYYMDKEEYQEMQEEYEGHFGGIGIVITMRDNKLTIVSPIKGTPGERAGLKAGDIISEISGQPTADMSQNKAVELMRGEPGTKVELTIDRKEEEDPIKVMIIRADIEVPIVEWEMKEDKIGYLSISQFIDDVGYKLEKAIAELEAKGAKGLILDLRSNPGGLLVEAVNVTSNFVEKGKVVSVKNREGQERILTVNPKIKAVTELPLIVMINQGSASASEIVAGAIKDHQRGKLLGMKSFGKGVVQTVVPLQDGSAVSLTTARYYTPSGNYIHEKGIKPDIKVELDTEMAEAGEDNQLQEALELMESFIYVEEFQSKKAAGE